VSEKLAEYRLSKTQQRAVVALARDRERLVADTQEQLAEIDAALQELAGVYAGMGGLEMPAIFRQDGQHVVLVEVRAKEEPEPAAEPTEAEPEPEPAEAAE
jgi:hypothetical protein